MRNIYLHEKQIEVMNCDARYIGGIGGWQSGKSYGGVCWLLNRIQRDNKKRKAEGLPVYDYMMVAPTYKVLNQALKKRWDELTPRNWYTFNKTDMEIKTRWGNTVYLRSSDKPEGLEGVTVAAILADEGAAYKLMVWEILRSRIATIDDGQILIITSPRGLNFVYHDIVKPYRAGDPDYKIISWPSWLNPAFGRARYEKLKKQMDSRIFEMRYGAKFIRMAGLIWEIQKKNLFKNYEGKERARFIVVDFGFKHYFACLEFVWLRDKGLYVTKEYGATEKRVVEHANEIAKRFEPCRYIVHDPRRPESALDLKEALKAKGWGNIKLRKAPAAAGDVDDTIEMVSTRLYKGSLFLHENLPKTHGQIETYSRDEQDKVVKEDDDFPDCLRYGVGAVDKHLIGGTFRVAWV